MRFVEIAITNFRNIKKTIFSCHPRVNIFIGENAQGKTNLLESIYLLTQGKSFRTTDMNVLLNQQEEYFALSAKLEKGKLNHKINYNFLNNKRAIKINEKNSSRVKLAKYFSSVLFSPESLSVIKESDRERRDLVDDFVNSVYVDKSVHIEDYKKLHRQRNKLLKNLAEGELENTPKNRLYLESLTQKFLEIGAELTVARLQAIEEAMPKLKNALKYILNVTDVDIQVDYVISRQVFREKNKQKIYNAMYKRWLELQSAETQCGYSLIGPHKHDIRVLFEGRDSRYYCSQGQQRLLILAFKMAQIELHYFVHGIYPILLLDDVLSELDEKKKVRLIEYLDKTEAQIFITTAEKTILDHLDKNKIAVYEVEKGSFINSSYKDPIYELD